MNNKNTKQITQEEVKKLEEAIEEAYKNKKRPKIKNIKQLKNSVKMYFWRIANKRYMQNKKNKLIDNTLYFIVNKLLSKW